MQGYTAGSNKQDKMSIAANTLSKQDSETKFVDSINFNKQAISNSFNYPESPTNNLVKSGNVSIVNGVSIKNPKFRESSIEVSNFYSNNNNSELEQKLNHRHAIKFDELP